MTSVLGRLTPGRTAKVHLFVDLGILLTAILIATRVSSHQMVLTWVQALEYAACISLFWVVISTALRFYDPWANRDTLDEAALSSVLVMAMATALGIINFTMSDGVPVPQVGTFLLCFWPAVLLVRIVVFRRLYPREAPIDEVLIVGTSALGRATGEDICQKPAGRKLLGYLSFPQESAPDGLPAPYLGSSDDLEKCLKSYAVSEVYIAGNAMKSGEAMQAIIKTCEKYGVPFALPVHTFRFDRARALATQAVSDGYLHYLSVDAKQYQMAIKRLFDIVASAAALWLLTPLLLVVAIIIKLTSRGPVFFKQVRVGLHGRTFHMLKFRSMVQNAEELKKKLMQFNEQTGPVFKMKRDPRITAIGRFIRKYSIDELPQLINVLRGDMSVVGPRPPVPSEVALYEPWQRRRLSVRPGLTCIWQVSGRNQISFTEWMYLDMQYIDHWSLTGDFNLILKTVPVVFTGRGAS
jgi:exopolysaccharide biosynthesis polyprenyl glycosylphosphotransferase